MRRLVPICILLSLLCTGCAQPTQHAPEPVPSQSPDIVLPLPEPVETPAEDALPVVAPAPEVQPTPEVVPEPPAPETPAPPVEPPQEEASQEEVPPAPAAQPEEPPQEEPPPEEAPPVPVDEPASAPGYDFSAPVPESPGVDNTYFADAAFVGDSRTEGFWLFSGIKQGKKLTCDGLSVFTLGQKKAITVNGSSYTLLEALALDTYGKVYLCLGVNELGYRDNDAFYQAYCDAIDAIRACQPNAVIYVQTLPPLNEGKIAASGGFGYLKNDRLRLYNDLIRQAATEKQVALLDLYTFFAVDGQLPADASRDGVHLLAPYCKLQLEYFQTHTVDYATLYPAPQPDPLPTPEEPISTEVPE